MTIYNYRALTPDGKKASGVVEAAGRREASEILRSRGVHVVSMQSVEASPFGAARRVSSRRSEQAFLFTTLMRRLLRARLPIVEALEAAGSELESRPVGQAVARCRDRVAGGSSLADALSHEDDFFDALYIAMVRAAEASGTLAPAFETIHDYESRRREFKRRLWSALAYPIVLICAAVLAVGFLMSFVVPRISATLASANVSLPLITRALMVVSALAEKIWPFALALAVLVLLLPRIMRSFARTREVLDSLLLRAPLARRFTRSVSLSRFCRTLSALVSTGLRVADALEISGTVSSNVVFEASIAEARSRIVSGSGVAQSLADTRLFPGYALQIIAIGERTGSLSESFEEIAVSEEEILETTTERFLILLEPIIIILMAVVVGFIVASVLLPILSMSSIAG